jgi:hypothetical protein
MVIMSYNSDILSDKCTSYFYLFNEWSVQYYLDKFFIIFLEDILIYSKIEEEHELLELLSLMSKD